MDMSIALGIAALVGVSAITPGPNNVAVMAAAAHRGFRGALPAVAGVVLGSLIMVLLAMAGLGAFLATAPLAGVLLSFAGCAYLGYLGLRMFSAAAQTPDVASHETGAREAGAPQRPAAASGSDRPVRAGGVRSDFTGLLLFQFLNPKGWAMVLTAVAAAQAVEQSAAGAAWLMGIFLLIPALCLSLWALFGALLSRQLERPRFRRGFDRLMGATLVVSALLLLVDALHAGGAAALGEVWR
jgi:threonine/homoserine/homoserine lactone efflux protein